MDQPKSLEITENYARFCPQGQVSLREAVGLLTNAIAFCCEQNIPKLLADLRQLTGFDPPTMFERRWAIEQWARQSKGTVILVTVLHPDWVDPAKFGVMIASSMGMRSERFTTEPEAIEWLSAQPLP